MNRTFQVLWGFTKFFLAFLLEEAIVRIPLVRRLVRQSWKPRNPARLRQYCVDMGGAFIKFGQFFSIRSDILPPAYCRQLSTLYDKVPSFPADEARAVIEEELGAPIEELFETFDDVAVGAASFGQGHLVTLKGENAGKQAVVKVSRPGSAEQIVIDTRLLLLLGRIVDSSSVLGQIKLTPIFRDFARWTRREVHYMQEAKNADHLYEVTDWNVRQRVPYIYWEYTTNRILTMEYFGGIPISQAIERFQEGDPSLDLELVEMECDRLVLARNLWQSFLLQAFVGHVFHGDPHPGNLNILPENTIGFLDFGLLGRLNEEARREQMLMMEAVVKENLERLFVAVLDVLDAPRGLAVSDTYEDFSEEADEWLDACDNPGATFEEKTITRLVHASMSIARQIGLVLPMQTMLYFKALLTVDSVVLRLAPEFDYKKETRRAIRLIRMRELDKLYSPGAVIDRALSLQLLANFLPDFLVARLQDFEQGQKQIFRKLNWFWVALAWVPRTIAYLLMLAAVVFLGEQIIDWIWRDALIEWAMGRADTANAAVRGAVVSVLNTLNTAAWSLLAVPVIYLVLIWFARSLEARRYVKIQKSE